MIALRSLTLRSRVPGTPLFEGLDLTIAAGEAALVSGRSGSGKSALVRLLSGAAVPDGGQVLVFERDLARLRRSSLALLRRRVAVVAQENALLERETALTNAAASLLAAAVPPRAARERGMAALARFGIDGLAAVRASHLSSGQRRRVCLARAAAADPAILVCDDPTAHLDAAGRDALTGLVLEVLARGGAALIASSDPALVAQATRNAWHIRPLGELSAIRSHDHRSPGDTGSSSGVVQVADRPEPAARSDGAPNVVPFPLSARVAGRRGPE